MALAARFLLITALVTVLYQSVFFVMAAALGIDTVTDFAGCSNFIIVAVLTVILHGSWYLRQIVLTVLVVIWGLRLGIFLLVRILQWGKDHRFDHMHNNKLRYSMFWVLQAIWVWTVSLPVTIVNASNENPVVHSGDILGWILWVIGFVTESIADQQKMRFKSDPQNKGRWCDTGLWGWSRHPNYFGEILLWWGIFIAATPVLNGFQWAVVAGPVFTTLILLFASGIPILEASAGKCYSGNAEYRRYKFVTSPLIPLPSILYGGLPGWFKTTFLFEFPLYSRKLSAD
eukprot:c27658_g1_i1 orf=104-964(+)